MEPRPADLCSYCSRLVPPGIEPSSVRAHQPNVALFLQFAGRCVMCKMIQDHWRLGEAQQRFPDVDEATYESIAVTVKFKDVQSLASGVSWAILQVELYLPSHAFVYTNIFSITTCKSECKLSSNAFFSSLTPCPNSVGSTSSYLESFYHISPRQDLHSEVMALRLRVTTRKLQTYRKLYAETIDRCRLA